MKRIITILLITTLLSGCSGFFSKKEIAKQPAEKVENIAEPAETKAEPIEIKIERPEIKTEPIEKKPSLENTKHKAPSWTTHKGPYFEVKYPSDFKIEYGRERDSVFFYSKDMEVAFYIFSPLWAIRSEPLDAKPDELFQQVSEKIDQTDCRRVLWRTLKSPDYYFSIVDTVQDTLLSDPFKDNDQYCGVGGSWEQKTFGIKYKNQEAYDKYRNTYLEFKNSLIQYAD